MIRGALGTHGTICALLLTTACARRAVPLEPADDPVQEFAGAYPVAARETGQVREYDLTAAPTEITIAAGSPRVRAWAYGGTVPGPTLRARVGDRVRVRFTNRLPQSTTIHWHGVRVPNDMDGVPGPKRPPIEPGTTFTYDFVVKDSGTYWFHPHVRSSEQVERGLYGVLIVEDQSPAPFDADVVWVLDDWLLGKDGQLVESFNTPHDLSHDGRWGNLVTVNGSTRTSLRVRAGDRVRLRLLNSANARIFAPDFSRFDAKLIAVDGLYLRAPIPFPPRFEIAPGNRIDLDIRFDGMTAGSSPIVDNFVAQRPNTLGTIVVDGVGPRRPAFDSPARAKVPRWQQTAQRSVDKEFRLDVSRGGPLGLAWSFNGRPFAGHAAHGVHAEHAMTMVANRFYKLRFTNDSHRLHPIHLHGMFFRLLARDGTFVDEPFFRDTVLVHGKETVDIGVVPLDTGDWMMHCHILEHAEAGMMTMLHVGGAP